MKRLAGASVALAAFVATASATQRVYEIDRSELGPTIEPARLSAALRDAKFDLLVIWLDPARTNDDAVSGTWPSEPVARMASLDVVKDDLLHHALEPFVAAGHQLAIGVARAQALALAATDPIPVDPLIRIENPAANEAALDLLARRAARPAVHRFAWSDRDYARRASRLVAADEALALSARLVAPTIPALRARQIELDVASFGADDVPNDAALVAQSQLASAVADRFAARVPQSLLALENEWIGARSAATDPPTLRREPPALDLLELLFSLDAEGHSLVDELDREPTAILDPAAPLAADDDAAAELAPFLLSSEQRQLVTRLLEAELSASWHFGRFMALGLAAEQQRAREIVVASAASAASLGGLAPAWKETCERDLELLDAALPWRTTVTSWSVARDGDRAPAALVRVCRVDDERVGAWAHRIEQALGGEQIDLARLLRCEPGMSITLTTEFELRDPRTVRLLVDTDGVVGIDVAGASQIDGYDGRRGPLLTTLSLAAGKSRVAMHLRLGATRSDVRVELLELPHRIEGISFEPDRASRIVEPAVRLHDPNAVGEESLVWPEGRKARDGSDARGFAAFGFPIAEPALHDLWIHALPAASGATLDVTIDGGHLQTLAIPESSTWSWRRAPAPWPLGVGDHTLRLTASSDGLRVDAITLLPARLALPRVVAPNRPLGESVWRFDPLGAGLVVDLPPLAPGEIFGRAFTVDKSGSYDLFVWLKGREPLAPGDTAEVELSSPSIHQRFVLPYGLAYEEWLPLGSVNFTAGDRVELLARGKGSIARLSFVR